MRVIVQTKLLKQYAQEIINILIIINQTMSHISLPILEHIFTFNRVYIYIVCVESARLKVNAAHVKDGQNNSIYLVHVWMTTIETA